jgi:hypothetical protein
VDLFEEFSHLIEQFEREGIEYALCGGLAMAVYAFPRATIDIDILIEAKTLEKLKKIAKALDFSFDAGLMSFKGGVIQIHRLTKVNENSSDALVLDMLLVTPGIEKVWETKKTLNWEGGTLVVVSPEGLIQLKLLRHSGQDQDDIKYLRKLIDEG